MSAPQIIKREKKRKGAMLRLQCACTVAALTVSLSVLGRAQTDASWPTKDEINLTLTQTDRALPRYTQLLDEQEMQMGKSVADQVAADRRLVGELDSMVKALRAEPQGFNGPMGFIFFESLSVADRNILQCGMTASSQSAGYMTAAKPEKAEALFRLSQSCIDLSTLIFTIREHVGSLYKRYIDADYRLAAQSTQEARQCADALEKSKSRKLGPVF